MEKDKRYEIALRALPLVDLTDLTDDCDEKAIDHLCQRAQTPFGSVGAICIWPRFIAHARAQLGQNGLAIATVVNFPSGNQSLERTVEETIKAVEEGANEIDMVIPYQDFIKGDEAKVQAMLVGLRAATLGKAALKVILETGILQKQELIHRASIMAIEAGADFIKTSTGKVAINATLEAAEIMLQAIKQSNHTQPNHTVGFKPAGGVKTVEDCAAYLALADRIMGQDWANQKTFRFGASGVLDDVLAALDGTLIQKQKPDTDY